MLYINEKIIKDIGVNWNDIINVIEDTVKSLEKQDIAQPIKPYLRYRDEKNRIIAMPAFVGGNIDMAGIKWIASFPDNIKKDIPRAHGIVILNDSFTGKPVSILNTTLISIMRTAGVSGALIRAYDKVKNLKKVKVGIIGWGPIGQYHFKMVTDLFGRNIENITIYDIRQIDRNTIDGAYRDKVTIADYWREAYVDADICITCTVSKAPYIDIEPKKGSLLLNVSLRDYKVTEIYDFIKKGIVVDDWEEVCREDTDVEVMYKEKGLRKDDTKSIIDVICKNGLREIPQDQAVMFSPMGMAIFDIAVGTHYFQKVQEVGNGQVLE